MYPNLIQELAVKNQQLITRSLDFRLIEEARTLAEIDRVLVTLFMQHKQADSNTHYIWNTSGDDKVRPSHAANNGKIFALNNPPATGHPGQDYNCRCWAEPVGVNEYVSQLLITPINDNPRKWTNKDFNDYYNSGKGGVLSLSEVGYFAYVENHFGYKVETSDGSEGGYKAVNKQIITEARKIINGPVPYKFAGVYTFGTTLDIFSDTINNTGYYSFGGSTVKGIFTGDVRQEENGFLVINGVMDYEFGDKFADRFQVVEFIDTFSFLDREEAEKLAEEWFRVISGPRVFSIVGSWQTKFNATVRLHNQ